MKKIHILVEGMTEQEFVNLVLKPHFQRQQIYLESKIVETGRVKSGASFKGGVVSYGKVRNGIKSLLGDTGATLITTMFDFYGLPTDFPGYKTMPVQGTCYDRVYHLEKHFMEDIASRRFLPYFSLHEFEAMLFADVRYLIATFPTSEKEIQKNLLPLKEKYPSPEEINDKAPPSKRIAAVLPEYKKAFHSPAIASEIGLDKIRESCPHFAAWVKILENSGIQSDD